MKKNLLTVSILSAVFMAASVSALAAEEFLSANDLELGAFTSPKTIDAFVIMATAEKNMQVDAQTPAITAADGEVFNARIKFGGAGAATHRSLKFSTKAKAEMTVYLSSSNKTDVRVLCLVNAADGTVVAEIPAPVYNDATCEKATVTIPAAGDWYVMSKNSGLYLYQIIVK